MFSYFSGSGIKINKGSIKFWRFFASGKTYTELALKNRTHTEAFNENILSVFTLIGGALLLLPLLAVPFSETKASIIPVYLLGSSFFFILFFLFKLKPMKKYILFGLYITFSILFIFAIYLSVIHTPHMRATILLGAFCIMPLGFIDRPLRINLFVFFWFAVHAVLAFILKAQYALDEIINSLCFAILGCYIGNMMVHVRLESYEATRLLTIEKETDVLTGLLNRRKLFEVLVTLESPNTEKPTGVMMLDIDHFKEFNDLHGHAAGDRCLNHFGRILWSFKQNFRIHFYRYGGEEFVAMVYGYDRNELLSIAESIRIAVQSADMDGFNITVSIGAVYCADEHVTNYERIIDRADIAVYEAKHAGRNIVCMEPMSL